MTEEAYDIEERWKNHGGNKVKEQTNRKFSESQYLGQQDLKMQKNKSIKRGIHNQEIKVKCSFYRPGVAQRVGRGIALLFHDCGTRRGWVVSSTPRPHFTPGKDPVPILQEAGWAPGPFSTGGKSRPHRDSIPDRPARSQSLIINTRLKILKGNGVSAWKITCRQLRKIAGSNERAAETGCRGSVLHAKTNESTVVESYRERKTTRPTRWSRKFRSLRLRLLSSFVSNIVYLWYFFHFKVDIVSFRCIKFSSFHSHILRL